MSTQACMGGWCAKRAHCANYHAENRDEPEERLCLPGHDGAGMSHPVHLHKPAGTWERAPSALLQAPGPWDVLA